MSRCVSDNKFAFIGREEPIGHIDRDPLLPLSLQTVQQQRVIDIITLGADLFAVNLKRRQMVFKYKLGIPEQPADQSALAVINAAAGDKAQHRFLFVGL